MSITAQAEMQTTAIKLVEQSIDNAKALGVSRDRIFDAVRAQGVGTGQPVELVEVEKPKPEFLTIYTVWAVLPDHSLRLFGAVDGETLDNEPMIWDSLKAGAAGLVGKENVRVASTDVALPLNLLKPLHQPEPTND